MVDLCFVAYEGSSGPSRPRISAMRSHARRAAHRKVRHNRMSEHHTRNLVSALGRQCSPISGLDSSRCDPFQSLALPVDEVEQMLIDYYVTVFAPAPSSDCTVIIPADIYTHQVTTQWVPFAFADQCLMNGLLLQGCRKIAGLQGHPQAEYCKELAFKYKIACIQLLRQMLYHGSKVPSDKLIAGSLWLALDEIEEQNMIVAASHVRAVELMVELRGGRESLGLEGFLEQVVLLCSFHVKGKHKDEGLASDKERQ